MLCPDVKSRSSRSWVEVSISFVNLRTSVVSNVIQLQQQGDHIGSRLVPKRKLSVSWTLETWDPPVTQRWLSVCQTVRNCQGEIQMYGCIEKDSFVSSDQHHCSWIRFLDTTRKDFFFASTVKLLSWFEIRLNRKFIEFVIFIIRLSDESCLVSFQTENERHQACRDCFKTALFEIKRNCFSLSVFFNHYLQNHISIIWCLDNSRTCSESVVWMTRSETHLFRVSPAWCSKMSKSIWICLSSWISILRSSVLMTEYFRPNEQTLWFLFTLTESWDQNYLRTRCESNKINLDQYEVVMYREITEYRSQVKNFIHKNYAKQRRADIHEMTLKLFRHILMICIANFKTKNTWNYLSSLREDTITKDTCSTVNKPIGFLDGSLSQTKTKSTERTLDGEIDTSSKSNWWRWKWRCADRKTTNWHLQCVEIWNNAQFVAMIQRHRRISVVFKYSRILGRNWTSVDRINTFSSLSILNVLAGENDRPT